MDVIESSLFYQLLFAAIYLLDYESVDPKFMPRSVPQKELRRKYDFVIVGGGIAGCVLAHRLSENPFWTIILIEAGGDETPLSHVPLLWPTLKNTILDWNFTTVPQKHVCKESWNMSFPRGRVLGGTSVINALLHVRGNKRDLNQGSEDFGVTGWTYKDMLPFFIKSENATGLNLPYSKYRGYEGSLLINYAAFQNNLAKDFVNAGTEYGWIERDYNADIQENTVAIPQLNVDGHIRQSASRAYLYPITNRKNLHIIKNSYVIKILIDEKNKKAKGVKYIRDGIAFNVFARFEVIITAGVVKTPQLLMLSGIGPKKELETHGIRCIVNLTVGQNLQDQVNVKLCFKINKNVTLTSNIWRCPEAIFEYVFYKTGPLSSPGIGVVAYNGKEESTTPPTISYTFDLLDLEYSENQLDQIICVTVSLLHPASMGSVKLANNDPWSPPLIDPNYFKNKTDYIVLKNGVEEVFKYMKTPTMKKYSPKLYTKHISKCANLKTNKLITCIMKNYVFGRVRPVGSTTVGPENFPLAVMTDRLLVRGFKNLRVVGSSVISVQLTGYAYGGTYAVAERSVPFIVNNYLKKPTTNAGATTTKSTTKKPHQTHLQEATSKFQQILQMWKYLKENDNKNY